ncbi:MAG: spore maturation protein [Clostridia bacterium]|nr:spore maturation protein [Clostridia bacterium]
MRAAEIAIPCGAALLLLYALVKKVNVYKAFVDGAKDALPQLVSILPYLAAMLTAIETVRASGLTDLLVRVLRAPAERAGLEPELIPLIVLRPFSGSGSLALLREILTQHGADSGIGRAASVLVGSTETVFYTVALYFGSVGVTKTRHAIPASLIAGAVGAAVGILLVRIM